MSRSARKALDLLAAVAAAEEPVGLMQASADASLDKSTALRLLTMLEEMSLVYRDPRTKRYDIGPSLVRLASQTISRVDILKTAYAALSRLRDLTDETVSLHLRAGDRRVCIHRVESRQSVRRVIRLGESQPLTAGSTGRLILAMLPRAEAAAIVRASLADEQEAQRCLDELAGIRGDGHLVTESPLIPELRAACVPVRVDAGRLAALAVSGPSLRWLDDRARSFLPQITATARELELILREDTQQLWQVPAEP